MDINAKYLKTLALSDMKLVKVNPSIFKRSEKLVHKYDFRLEEWACCIFRNGIVDEINVNITKAA